MLGLSLSPINLPHNGSEKCVNRTVFGASAYPLYVFTYSKYLDPNMLAKNALYQSLFVKGPMKDSE